MATNKRSKALSRVVKLLNLATSDVDHEADLALNHAHSVIQTHGIQRYELDTDKLCDESVLDLIDWYGEWTDMPVMGIESDSEPEPEEYSNAPNYYAFARGIREKNTYHDRKQSAATASSNSSSSAASDNSADTSSNAKATANSGGGYDPFTESKVYWDFLTDPIDDYAYYTGSQEAANDHTTDTDVQSGPSESSEEELGYMVFEGNWAKKEALDQHNESSDAEDVAAEVVENEVCAFDPDSFSEEEALERLARLTEQLSAAEGAFSDARVARQQGDLDEETEKAIRIQAELEAELAAEMAFRKRAEAQMRWEAEMLSLRKSRRKSERTALEQLQAVRSEHEELQQLIDAHKHYQQEQQRLELLEDISDQLQVAAEHITDPYDQSFDRALMLMDDNRITLTDLPLEKIHHKSIFIRLLERESSGIENSNEREAYTEALLGKYLELYHPPAVDLAEQVIVLLKQASSGDPLEAESAFDKAQELLATNGMSIRDLEIGKIEQISLFIRLLNWEAEKLPDMGAREHFTAKMLDRYFEATQKTQKS